MMFDFGIINIFRYLSTGRTVLYRVDMDYIATMRQDFFEDPDGQWRGLAIEIVSYKDEV